LAIIVYLTTNNGAKASISGNAYVSFKQVFFCVKFTPEGDVVTASDEIITKLSGTNGQAIFEEKRPNHIKNDTYNNNFVVHHQTGNIITSVRCYNIIQIWSSNSELLREFGGEKGEMLFLMILGLLQWIEKAIWWLLIFIKKQKCLNFL
jgi:hypothetical protein